MQGYPLSSSLLLGATALLLARPQWSLGLVGAAAVAGDVAAPHHHRQPPIAMGVNGHPFAQPNYNVGSDLVASGTSAGISFAQQFDELAALAPTGSGTPFYYRVDINCGWILGTGHPPNTTRGKTLTAMVQAFVRAAAARNLTVLPILFPDLGTAGYNDHAAVEAAAKASTGQCAKVMTALGLQVFEIGQEWDNSALMHGAAGDKPSEYNQTIYQHLLATLRGMSAGVRAASPSAQIGVNNGGWLHWAWFEMLLGDKLDIDFVAYHWYHLRDIQP